MSRAQRRALVEREDPALPVLQQCRLLAVSRASVYRRPAEVNDEDRAIMALIDRQYLARPYYGSRRMAAWLATQGHPVNRKRVQRLMRLIGLVAVYQRPNTSKPAAAHKVYPYQYAEWKRCRVNLDYHVEIAKHYYSVPHQLIRQEVEARITTTTVEIFHRGKRVASHRRSLRPHRPTTVAEHMPSSHRRYRDWTHQRIRREAEAVGPTSPCWSM